MNFDLVASTMTAKEKVEMSPNTQYWVMLQPATIGNSHKHREIANPRTVQ